MSFQVARPIGHQVSPRRLMAMAVLAAALGLLVTYLNVVDLAERTLALRQGPPVAVPLQEFRPRRDTGPAGEVLVHAELDVSLGRVLARNAMDGPARVWVAPLFPLSEIGALQAADRGARDAGPVSAQVARRAAPSGHRAAPAGYVVWPLAPGQAPPADAGALASATFGPGSFGETVSLNGEVVGDAALAALVAGAFSARGLSLPDRPVALAPYPAGRAAALGEARGSRFDGWAYRAAIVLALVALALEAFGRFGPPRRPASAAPAARSFAPPAHPGFAPLASQADLDRAEEDTGDAHAPKGLGAALARAVAAFRSRR